LWHLKDIGRDAHLMAFAAPSHVVATIQLTVEKRRTKSGKYAVKVYQASTFASRRILK
jgi:hypothetical protein